MKIREMALGGLRCLKQEPDEIQTLGRGVGEAGRKERVREAGFT